ncbi:MAG: hypothetical protein ABI895_42315 [Deltaproteobacteria bacterium]
MTDFRSVVQALEEIGGTPWPLLAGPVIRREGTAVCVDLAAATWRFLSLVPPTFGGEVANRRALRFEDSVQAAVDESPWRAPDDIRVLRRRPLRIAGQVVTDIDSVASSNETILLISCKSIVYRPELDAGMHKAVRNAAAAVEAAVADWQSKVERIRTHPVGDNYDLSRFHRILGVVCTPTPIWVCLGPATERISVGLSAACSLGALAHWARGESSATGLSSEPGATFLQDSKWTRA